VRGYPAGELIGRLPWWLPAVVLATLAVGLNDGLARGAAYGRYVAAQALVERRAPVLDGQLDGMRRLAGGALHGVAYLEGHYYLAEGPLATWLTSLLYAVGSLIAALAPGAGWAPAVTSLFGPLLLLATLLGVARLAQQFSPAPVAPLFVVVGMTLLTSLLAAAMGQSAWLMPAALLVWLLVGMRWRHRTGALGHGLLGGLLIGSQPLAGAGRHRWAGRHAA
jgi:hypothetical protein